MDSTNNHSVKTMKSRNKESRRLSVYNKGVMTVAVAIIAMVITACSVSYKFNGASIDYNKTKTIQIADFPIR